MVLVTVKNFNEKDYLTSNPDVAKAVQEGVMASGRKHFYLYGRNEGRKMRVTLNTVQRLYSRIINILFSAARIRPPQFLEVRNQSSSKTSFEQLQSLEAHVKDIEILLQQVLSILHYETNIPLPPPKHLQIRVVGGYVPEFIGSGFTSIYPTLNRVLEPVGKEVKDFQTILDFGCGCGRAIRALATLTPNSKLYGTDIDEEAIEWLKDNYSKFAEFSVAPNLPPTIYEDQMFDLVFGISVLTHLPEEMQFQWLRELSRITKPGGCVILTTHGEKHYWKLNERIIDIMNKKGFFYYGADESGFNYGKSISLPDFYQTAFHSHAYIRREWGKYFDIIDIQALGIDNHQDTVLLQKRH